MFLDFQNFPIILNLAIFVVAGAVTWFAGTRAAKYADGIAKRTGLGKAFVGVVFLALATETPEIATTITAATLGNAPLAVNNLFGGIVTQTTMLVVADILLRQNALTYITPKPVLALQGQLLIILLGLASGLMLVGELVMIGHVGLWTPLLLGAYLLALFIVQKYEKSEQRWKPMDVPEEESDVEQQNHNGREEPEQKSTRRLTIFFIVVSLVILAAGFVLAQTADALAVQTGLGASFLGATLLALSTSLPELSTVVAAVRLGNSSMAIANIFGSNLIMIALLFLTDFFYTEGPVLQDPQASTIFAALMGMVVTAVYLAGLTERGNKVVLRMGIDSIVVLVLYIVTIAGLYTLR